MARPTTPYHIPMPLPAHLPPYHWGPSSHRNTPSQQSPSPSLHLITTSCPTLLTPQPFTHVGIASLPQHHYHSSPHHASMAFPHLPWPNRTWPSHPQCPPSQYQSSHPNHNPNPYFIALNSPGLCPPSLRLNSIVMILPPTPRCRHGSNTTLPPPTHHHHSPSPHDTARPHPMASHSSAPAPPDPPSMHTTLTPDPNPHTLTGKSDSSARPGSQVWAL